MNPTYILVITGGTVSLEHWIVCRLNLVRIIVLIGLFFQLLPLIPLQVAFSLYLKVVNRKYTPFLDIPINCIFTSNE